MIVILPHGKFKSFQYILDIAFWFFLLYLSYRAIFFLGRASYYTEGLESTPLDVYFYNFNFVFHELGHVVFSIIGEFFGVLGGTIAEFIFPAIFFIYFVTNGKFLGASFCIWWSSFNLITTGVYMKDAALLALPLLIEDGTHDFVYIFKAIGVLDYSSAIGTITITLGILGIIFSMFSYGYVLIDMFKNRRAIPTGRDF